MGKFVIQKTAAGYHFALHAANGETIAVSQKYAAEESCMKGVDSVRHNAAVAQVEDQTVDGYEKVSNPKFEIYRDHAGEFRFRLKARNGEIIASSEGYKAKASCKNGITSVVKNAPEAEIAR